MKPLRLRLFQRQTLKFRPSEPARSRLLSAPSGLPPLAGYHPRANSLAQKADEAGRATPRNEENQPSNSPPSVESQHIARAGVRCSSRASSSQTLNHSESSQWTAKVFFSARSGGFCWSTVSISIIETVFISRNWPIRTYPTTEVFLSSK